MKLVLDVDKIKKTLVNKLTTVKFNPNHGADGRFTSGSGGSGGSGGGSSGGGSSSSGERHRDVTEADAKLMEKHNLTAEKLPNGKVSAVYSRSTKDPKDVLATRRAIHKDFESRGWKASKKTFGERPRSELTLSYIWKDKKGVTMARTFVDRLNDKGEMASPEKATHYGIRVSFWKE